MLAILLESHPRSRRLRQLPAAALAIIPDQQVGADGAISVPYAGRVPVVNRLPAEVQQAIETRLAEKALGPQPLVIVKKSAANALQPPKRI